MKNRRLLKKLLVSPANARFEDIVRLVKAFGFRLSRISGSHHVFVHPSVDELVNFQEVHGEAKPYQIRQFLRIVEKYNLRLGDDS
jgi:predicted RNA binding protein YcfA (HicA-like mRNA interferase family)